MQLKEVSGDLWTFPAEYRCITTNGVLNSGGSLVMGAGIAKQAKEKFPHLPVKLGAWVKQYGNRPFICKTEGLITFPTKHDWKDDSDIELIASSAKLIVEIVNKFGIKSVVCTRPGCGNGHLNWVDVKSKIQNIFDNRFTIVS